MKNRVLFCLNNETAGPNLQVLIGIAACLFIMGALIRFTEKFYDLLGKISSAETSIHS